MAPPLPLTARPIGGTLSARQGDVGAVIAVYLYDGTCNRYFLPEGSTVAFASVEAHGAPTRERREPRTFSGAAAIDADDASLVTYALEQSDTAHAGEFEIAFTATLPGGEVLTWPSGDALGLEITAPLGA